MTLSMQKQRGIGLLELMLSLAIIAILLIMATRYFTSANTNQQVNNAVDQFNGIRGAVNSYYSDNGPGATAPQIAGLSTDGYLPKNYSDGKDPWGGDATLDASNNPYSVRMAGVPSTACEMLAKRMSQIVDTSAGEQAACENGTVTVKYSR